MQGGGLPVTSDVAANRWHLRLAPNRAPIELDDVELLEWIRHRATDADAMRTARFRHGYERTWITSEAAAGRVLRARAEVLGARIGAAVAAVLLPGALLAGAQGTPAQAGTLAAALTTAGAFALLWRGASVLARVAVLEAVAVTVLVAQNYGVIVGIVTGLYLPPVIMAAATMCGARLGTRVAADRHARLRRRLAGGGPERVGGEAEDAVAA